MGEMFDDADEASYVEAIPIHLFQDTSEVEQYPAPCQHSTYIIITPDLNERSDVQSSLVIYSRSRTFFGGAQHFHHTIP